MTGPASLPVRVVLLGMPCGFTEPVLAALNAAPDVDLAAVVLATRGAAHGGALPSVAGSHRSPVIDLGATREFHGPEIRATLERLAPDLVVVACFPWRLPGWLLALPRLGCVNVHPSLLPDLRGPQPVFWALRLGLSGTGVTLHMMDEGFDTGPIIAQRPFAIPGDVTLPGLEQALARFGAELLTETLPAVRDGSARPVPQPDRRAHAAPVPGPDDLVVPTSWAAARAARFIRAISPVYGPLPVLVEATGQRLAVAEVLGFEPDGELSSPVLLDGDRARIRFAPGVLDCRLAVSRERLVFIPGRP